MRVALRFQTCVYLDEESPNEKRPGLVAIAAATEVAAPMADKLDAFVVSAKVPKVILGKAALLAVVTVGLDLGNERGDETGDWSVEEAERGDETSETSEEPKDGRAKHGRTKFFS